MRVTKRTAVHNIFDSACLKGYIPFSVKKLGHFITNAARRQWDLMFCSVSVYHLNFVFCLSLSGTTWIRTTASTVYIIKTDAGNQGWGCEGGVNNLACVCCV